jgi:pyruvate dehydrogenase E2 component (dihydrolipoamide acetyltransferase)
MPAEIKMPQLSDTMSEGTLVKWHKKEGDKVRAGEEIADVETDKATMPMEASAGGTLAFIAVQEGQKVQVGSLLAVIASGSENADEIRKKYAAAASAPVQKQAEIAASAPAKAVAAPLKNAPAPAMVSVAASAPESAIARRPGNGQPGRIRISPLARRIAAQSGLDLSRIAGSGPGGRIVQRDIEDTLAQGGAGAVAKLARKQLPPAIPSGQTQVIPITKMRAAIAAALQRSKQTIPHFYETIDIDVEELTRLRERLNAQLERENIRLSIADFVNKGVAIALTQHPALNARFNSEKGEITRYGDVNLGLAVAIPDGLIVPVLRGVNLMDVKELRIRSADLVERARAQRLKREEQSEGTFTISSLGAFGIREFSAIINPPEVAILAVGAAEKRVVARGEGIMVRTMLTVTLSVDHRAVDGATAAEFLRTLKQTLEEPAALIV